jgi:Tol biopolymer transport system component
LFPTGISPDGQWLVLGNQSERQEDIYVVRSDGTGLRRLTDDVFRDRIGVWSPDGKEIAFYSNRTDTYGIWAVKPDGSGLHALTELSGADRQNLLYPTYSPTGDRLVASRLRSDEVLFLDPRKAWSAQKPEFSKMPVGSDSWLVPSAWSPDGRRLVGLVTNASGSALGVGVYDVASRQVRKVIDGGAAFFGYVWLGDSRRVVYPESDADTLWLVDVESGRRKALATGLNIGIGLVASPDRRTLYPSIRRQQADIWMIETGQKSEVKGQK